MKRPKIIEGQPFDWDAAREASEHVQREDGSINWRAAMSMDPGVMSCPFCDEYMDREGTVVECPTCGQHFNTNWREVAREATGQDPVTNRSDYRAHANIVRILHDIVEATIDRGEPFRLPPQVPPLIRQFAEAARASS